MVTENIYVTTCLLDRTDTKNVGEPAFIETSFCELLLEKLEGSIKLNNENILVP